MTTPILTPIECYLHRIFPPGIYKETSSDIVNRRLFKPRKDCDDFSLTSPIDWEARNRLADRNWRMQLQGWAVFQPIMNFFDSYEDQPAIIDFFFDLAEDWWNNYGNDPEDIVTSRMPESYAWYDMSVGFRALVIAFFRNRIDALDIKINTDRSIFLMEMAKKHVGHLTYEPAFSLNNHGIFQAHGLMALVQTFTDLDNREKHQEYAIDLMERLITDQFDDNGVHREHSPHYHFYVLATFEEVEKSGWFAGSTQIIQRVEKAREARKWIVDPLRRPICVGDSILTKQQSLDFPAVGSVPILSDIDSSGYQVLRSAWPKPPSQAGMVFLMGAYHSKTHKHRDCLSFDWFDRGSRIICDGGKYGYKSDKYRHYCLSNAAHNTVEIEGFDVLKTKPYGSAINASENLGGGVFKLSGKLNYPAIKFERSLYCKLGHWLIVEDTLDFVRKRNATQWFHLERDFELQHADGSYLLAKGEKGRTVLIECLNAGVHSVLHKGDELNMQGFVSASDYEISPALTVGFKIQTDDTKLTTILALNTEDHKDALNFAAKTLGNKIALQRIETTPIQINNPLPNINHYIIKNSRIIKLKEGEATYSVIFNDINFNFYASLKPHKETELLPRKRKLLIMFPGASSRAKGYIDYQRFSWASDFPNHDVISFSDPTLKPDNDIGLAWFQYHKDNYGIAALASLIKGILSSNDYHTSDVTLFGSSGGGFCALQLANQFPKSSIIAINPQIYLYNYTESFYKSMLEFCYPNMLPKDVAIKYKDRISVNIEFEKRESNIFILQNYFDKAHLNRHLSPFISSIDGKYVSKFDDPPKKNTLKRKLNIIMFSDEESGHSPPSREKTVRMITPLLG